MPARSGQHPIYSQDADVYIETGADKLEVLQRALDRAGFFENVERVFDASGRARAEFLIAIKPNIMTASVREHPSPIYTDPELVEYVVAELRSRGFENIAVVEARNVYDYSYQGRTVKAVAELVGYSGNGYRIEDLTEQPEPFDYGGVLGEHLVGRTWRDADYRVSFAKNKTHWQCFFTGCLKNVYGCLPEWDKMWHYHGQGREFYETCVLIADAFPVHFGLLDAWVSADGLAGHVRDGSPNATRTIFASSNIFALDWVMGEKMKINPALNYVIQEGMHRWGTIHITRHGNLTAWHPWINVRPFVVVAFDLIEEVYWLSRFLSRSFATQQDPRFPHASSFEWLFRGIHQLTRLLEPLLEQRA